MCRAIIVSDLHIDTWSDVERYGEGARERTKLEHWCDLLQWCDENRVEELIVNGDLMDAPPYEGNVSLTSAAACKALTALMDYASKRSVTYVFGNHDIGISGIRCDFNPGLAPLRNVSLQYPHRPPLHTDVSTILIQHGHLYDPALWLYVRDLTIRTYVNSGYEAFNLTQQRRDPGAGQPRPADRRVGVDSPAVIKLGAQPGNTLEQDIEQAVAADPPSKSERDSAKRFLKRLRTGVNRAVRRKVTHYFWREAAREVLRDFTAQHPADRAFYCIMGHTHVPDRFDDVINGRQCHYLNSGTWVGSGKEIQDRQCATYLYVDANGKVTAQDWIWDRKVGCPGT